MNRKYAEYLLKKTTDDYNLIAEDFSRTRSGPPKVIGQKSLQNYVKAGEKVLDLGCGNGRLFGFFKDKKIEYFGIDNSEKLLEIAKKNYPEANFQVVSALDLPFPDNYFDKIYSIAVLHQIPSEEFRSQFLKEARRVLKPGGLLILTVWYLWKERKARRLILRHFLLNLIEGSKLDFKDVFFPWKNSRGEIIIQRYYHCFTKKELKKIIKNANFKIKEDGLLKHAEGHYNIYVIAQK